MTSDPGLTRQDSDYATQIQEALDELQQLQEVPRVVMNAEDLDALERDIRGRTDRLSSLLLGLHLQHSLDSEELQAAQALLVSHWPKPLKHDGSVSNVEIERSKMFQIKGIGVIISTFETLPTRDTVGLSLSQLSSAFPSCRIRHAQTI